VPTPSVTTRVYDDLVGFVQLDALERRLWNHPILARLGHIRQLGVASNVFPGAHHTRLSHSLGTMYYAEQLARSFLEPSDESGLGKFPDRKFVKKVRLAALLHDIGHPALSHNVEILFIDQFKDALNRGILGTASTEENRLISHPVSRAVSRGRGFGIGENPFKNGTVSWYLIRKSSISKVLRDGGFDPDEIARIVAGVRGPPGSVYDQILNGGLDADKLDYLQRDSRATGVHYGSFDIAHILRSITRFGNSMCVNERAMQACVHFTLIRYFWYSQIIYNKNLTVFEEMVKATYLALAATHQVPSPSSMLDTLNRIGHGDMDAEQDWCDFTDRQVLSAMESARRALLRRAPVTDESVMDSDTLQDFLNRVLHTRMPLTTIARIEGIDIAHSAGTGLAWDHRHPRYPQFHEFVVWLKDHHKNELDGHKIILSENFVPLIKTDDENQIQIQTRHDTNLYSVKEHYGSLLVPIGGNDLVGLALRRVYCVDDLKSELADKWESLLAAA